jgi:hypothetical protein
VQAVGIERAAVGQPDENMAYVRVTRAAFLDADDLSARASAESKGQCQAPATQVVLALRGGQAHRSSSSACFNRSRQMQHEVSHRMSHVV